MSFSDSSALFSKTAIRVRLPRFIAVATLATTIVCVAGESRAATSSPDFTTMRYLALVSPDWTDDPSSDTFAHRFAQPQTSMMQDAIDRSVYPPPMMQVTAPVVASLPRKLDLIPGAAPILGTASMYNPNDASDADSGNSETASGEIYNSDDWTAAIRTDLRDQFGGVRFGKNYRPAFALVQISDKQAIVRINDVGPLKPGRIIDLNERAMRYFDPTMQRGLLDDVSVVPLSGQVWAVGPVLPQPVSIASFDPR